MYIDEVEFQELGDDITLTSAQSHQRARLLLCVN